MVKKIYNTIEELREAKKRNALATYYRKVSRDSEYINQKKSIRAILTDRILVKKLYDHLLILQASEMLEQSPPVVS